MLVLLSHARKSPTISTLDSSHLTTILISTKSARMVICISVCNWRVNLSENLFNTQNRNVQTTEHRPSQHPLQLLPIPEVEEARN